jgi:hypothetical protein
MMVECPLRAEIDDETLAGCIPATFLGRSVLIDARHALKPNPWNSLE